MTTFTPSEDAIISIDLDIDFSSDTENLHATWGDRKFSATVVLAPVDLDTADTIEEWLQPSKMITILMPKSGILPRILQFIHGFAPDFIKRRVEPFAYNEWVFPDLKAGESYKDEDGNWVIPFHKA